jgi:hypothetical protein
MANRKSASAKTPRLAIPRETLRRLADVQLDDVVGGGASWACDNQSVGFLCGDVCGGSKSCVG